MRKINMFKLLVVTVLMVSIFSVQAELDVQEEIAKFILLANECREEVGAKEADIQDLIHKHQAAGQEGKCLRACLMKKYEVLDANGKLVKSVALEHAKKFTNSDENKLKIASTIIDMCSALDIVGDTCEVAEQYSECFKKQADTYGITLEI
uniref:Uncharacterized protein n=1 Tax=Glossina palpalis gambiensis TaxID=67801 RepID=A0A1B0BII1_9MUSC